MVQTTECSGTSTARLRRGARQALGPAEEGPTAHDGDARARTRAFGLLCLALLVKSVGPGAVNYATNPHPPPSLEAVAEVSPLASQVSALGSVLVLLVSAVAVGRFGRTGLRVGGGALMLMALAILTQLRMTAGSHVSLNALAAQVSLVAVVLAVCALRPSVSDLGVIGLAGVLVAAYSAAFYAILPDNALFLISGADSIAVDKAVVANVVLAGPMSHSNALGSFLALTLPFIGLWRSRPRRLLGYGVVVAVLLLTASRTAIIAVGVIVAFALLRSLAAPFRARTATAVALIGAGASIVALPLLVTDSAAFSTRAAVWQGALTAWGGDGSPLFGIGAYWDRGVSASVTHLGPRTTSGHNLFVQWGVTGGLVMLALGFVLLVTLSRKALTLDRGRVVPVATGYVLVLLTVSIAEFNLTFTVASQLFVCTGLAMTALLVASEQPARGGAPDPAEPAGSRTDLSPARPPSRRKASIEAGRRSAAGRLSSRPSA